MTFGTYFRQLCRFVLSSSVVLGLIVGIVFFVVGETTIEVDLTFEFEALDGIWWILGLPLLSALLFVILSPLTFQLHRRLFKDKTDAGRPDSKQGAAP